MKEDSESAGKLLWDASTRRQAIRHHSKVISANAIVVFATLAGSHLDVILRKHEIEVSQFFAIPVSIICMAAIVFSVVQVRRVGELLGNDGSK